MRIAGSRFALAYFITFVIIGVIVAVRILTKPDSPLDGTYRIVVATGFLLFASVLSLILTFPEYWWIERRARA